MSLFMPLTTVQCHSKPMAISSITSPVGRSKETAAAVSATTGAEYDINNSPSLTCASSSTLSTQSETATPPTAGSRSSKSESSSPTSRTFSNYSSSNSFPGSPNQNNNSLIMARNTRSNSNSLPQPPIITPSFYHQYHYGSSSNNSKENNTVPAPLSIHERRLRNKTASAKYRAKKNQQHGEMRAMISSLTKENELLLRQLDHIQHENSHLKTTCDRLRGKIMAQKMLKQYLVENEQQQQQQQQQKKQQQTQHQHQNYQQQQLNMDQNQQSPNCFMQYHAASPLVNK
ncbi:hypothetical protein INT46_003955 [Mucor plumbeus]|uniref:BZIP domain-containing protein n=1 Tax=Mucor plumbeus TaxID=97098 RepID=A0A8H7RTY5_9FUNG|nr:hypothetical protein INT46_003955 [Mucor plumbeus]